MVIDVLSDFEYLPGDQSDQKLALQNIASMVKPGGILIIDHRNYDYILETGKAPRGKNIYYQVSQCSKMNVCINLYTFKFWVLSMVRSVGM